MKYSSEKVSLIAEAIFSKETLRVVEGYSEFDQEPIEFSSASELTCYLTKKLVTKRISTDIRVVYPDMGCDLSKEKIILNPDKVSGKRFRYTWSGWGQIILQFEGVEKQVEINRVTSNSEQRALKWVGAYPEKEAVDSWNWDAVGKHTRRLQRVLNKIV
jgi:hypothetical protein